MNSFLSFAFRRCKNSSPTLQLAYKIHLNRCFLSCKRHTTTALLIRCYSSRGAVVSVVSAFRFHFLTILNN